MYFYPKLSEFFLFVFNDSVIMHHISPASVFAVISGVYMDVGVYVSMHALE